MFRTFMLSFTCRTKFHVELTGDLTVVITGCLTEVCSQQVDYG